MTVIIIIGILFLALAVVVPMLEKSNWRMNSEEQSKLSRWLWPLLMILLVAQLIKLMIS
ncbi:hypothetical protein [Aestuariibacter sp. GS-14]|uniref:hypothetical protein n=1 Tax=Alteromonadaceae TaxID=72275 RepID=UPI0015E85EBA|nr:hypothetical protein [Aestuariibacter sp. GS-14]